MDAVKLRDPRGIFYDPDTGLRVVKAETVKLGNVGAKTREWLNAGGLILVKISEPSPSEGDDQVSSFPDVPPSSEPESVEPPQITEEPSTEAEVVVHDEHEKLTEAELRKMTISTLRHIAKGHNLKLSRSDNIASLVTKILAAQEE